MTAVKPVLDVYLELNLIIVLSLLVWLGVRFAMKLTSLRFAYFAQLRVLKALLLCIVLSPILAIGLSEMFEFALPGRPVALGDIAVAAFLRGDIALPATQFESLLNARERWAENVLNGGSLSATLVLAMLAVGATGLVLRVAYAAIRVRETVNSSFLWRRSAKVDIRLSDRISVPFAVRGLWRRHVVLPTYLLDKPEELRFAIAHEFQHVRAGDVEWQLMLELLRPLLFWNPAYIALKYDFERLRELGCDQSIVSRRRLNASDYANCLLNYCGRIVSRDGAHVLNVALVSGGRAKRVLRQRVLALSDAPRRYRPFNAMVCGCALVFVGVLAFGSASVRQADGWSHDRLMLSTVVNLERLAERNQGN
ncbi:BlaR1 peptidase M56 [Ruegeria halocynthiae]|uniref:BlaR1 peptidase M56 n=1 Tax=Ruegeria halocynthiae TaxID=985054 RepID=A0A1H2XTV3_9RHOB|nr:M56 family metallopeptidase [Ruegeria halocynthiae]SDW95759.1 BlaR1 peptidase M56 [Ruegeria halocynthiae]